MLLFRSDAFGGTHELLPCGLLGGGLVKLFSLGIIDDEQHLALGVNAPGDDVFQQFCYHGRHLRGSFADAQYVLLAFRIHAYYADHPNSRQRQVAGQVQGLQAMSVIDFARLAEGHQN